jgi:lauroyl/myristoyl acyltransferase
LKKIQNIIRTIYYLLFVLLTKLFHNKPRFIYKIGNILGKIRFQGGYIGKTRSKKSYIKTIKIALNITDEKNSEKIIESFWINHQKGFLELFISRNFNKDNIDKHLKFEGLEILDNALKRKNGIVLAVPHFGNERFIHIGLAHKGYPVSVITSRFENTTNIVRDIKLGAFVNLHSVGYPDSSPRWMYQKLQENKILQISPPADEGPNGLKIEFLNFNILVSKTPARLALKTHAALIPAFAHRNKDDTHTIKIKPELTINPTDDKITDIRSITEALMKIFESNIIKHPEQFYWMWLMIKQDEAQKFILGRSQR